MTMKTHLTPAQLSSVMTSVHNTKNGSKPNTNFAYNYSHL